MAAAGGHIHRHRPSLREAQQDRVLQRHRLRQLLQPLPQRLPGTGQFLPVRRRRQSIPLAADAGRMDPRRPKRHQIHRPIHQLLPQIQQVVGVGSPAMQQHQPAAGPLRSEPDRRAVITGGLVGVRHGDSAWAAAA